MAQMRFHFGNQKKLSPKIKYVIWDMDKWQPVKYNNTDLGTEKYSKSSQFQQLMCHSMCLTDTVQ